MVPSHWGFVFLQFPSLHHRIQPIQDESIWRKTTKTSPMPFRTDPLRLVKNQKEGFLPPLEEFQGGSHGCIHCRRSRELPFHRHPRSHKFAIRLHSLPRGCLFRTKPETFSHPIRVPQSRKGEILHIPTLLFCYIPAFCQQCSFAHARRPLNKKYASPLDSMDFPSAPGTPPGSFCVRESVWLPLCLESL